LDGKKLSGADLFVLLGSGPVFGAARKPRAAVRGDFGGAGKRIQGSGPNTKKQPSEFGHGKKSQARGRLRANTDEFREKQKKEKNNRNPVAGLPFSGSS